MVSVRWTREQEDPKIVNIDTLESGKQIWDQQLKVKDGFEVSGVELSCPYAFSKLTPGQGPTLRRHSGNRIHIKQDRDSGAQEKRSDEVGKMKAQEMSFMRLYISLYFMETEENSYWSRKSCSSFLKVFYFTWKWATDKDHSQIRIDFLKEKK